MNIEFIEATYV